jgi:transmembrane sensor
MINEKFKELLAKELSGEISAEERTAFQYLVKEDQALKKEYELLKLYWEESDRGQQNDGHLFEKVKNKIKHLEDQNSDVSNPKEISGTSIPKKSFSWIRIAAILLVFLGASLYLYKSNISSSENEPLLVKSTKKGVRSEIVLSDGTRVTLNSGSQLRYPAHLNGNTREVHLIGEAYFDVRKDAKHPFIVHTGKMDVKVLGTAFNVKTYPNEKTSETTLVHGSVQITLLDRPTDAIILKPSEKFIVKNASFIKHEGKIRLRDPEISATQYTLTTLTYLKKQDNTIVETSWMQNKLAFSNEDFTEVAHKMERWYGVDIQFANDEIKQYRFTALFQKETIKEALNALQMTEDFHYRMDHATIYIY